MKEKSPKLDDIQISPKIKFSSLRKSLASLGLNLGKLLESERIGIYLRGRDSGNWALAVSRGLSEEVMLSARVINQTRSSELENAINSKQPCLLEEALRGKESESIAGKNLIVVPLWCDVEVMGLLLADFDSFASLSDKHLIQLSLGARILKLAIEKEFLGLQIARIKEEQARESSPEGEIDFLNNESIIQWILAREMERSKRHGSSFSVMMIGLDNLPHLMSQYSPGEIEKILQAFYSGFYYLIRKCDLFTRWGGGKFLCVSMQQNAAGVSVLAGKLKLRAREISVQLGDESIKAMISIGIALWPDGSKASPLELIERADFKLTEAAQKGNRVRIWKTDVTN